MENPNADTFKYGHLIFDKSTKKFQQVRLEQLGIQIKMNFNTKAYAVYKMNSKRITDLNLKPQTIKHLQEKVGKYICELRLGK